MLPSLEVKITADTGQADAALDKTARKIKTVGSAAVAQGRKGIASFSGAMSGLAKATGGSMMQLRMLPQQFGQIAQQAAATGNVMQAVAIQAIDIGAAFGVAGLAVGALATVAIPALVAAFSDASEDATELEEAIAAVEERAATATAKLAALRLGVASTEEAAILSEINALLAERDQLLDKAAEKSGRNARAFELQAERVQTQVNSLQERLDLLRGAEQALSREEGAIGRITAGYKAYARSRIQAEQQANASIRDGYRLYADTRMEANKLAGEIGHAAANALALAGVDISSPISKANKEAAQLAANLGISLNAAISLQNLQNSMQYSGRGGDPRSFMGQLGTAFKIGTTAGGGGVSTLAGDLESVKEQLATESELLRQTHESQLETLREALASRLIAQEEFQEQSLRSKQQYEEAMAEIERARQAATLDGFSGMFGDLSTLMTTENKKLFNIGKAAAIAEATVSGYKAAVSAWEKGMAIGGPPMAAAFTGASLAKTGALISGIASQSIGGGGGGGASASAGAGAAAAPAPLEVRIDSIDPNALYQGSSIRNLFNALQDHAGDRGLKGFVV